MKSAVAVRSSLLPLLFAISLAGCSDSGSEDMSKKDIQYLSHLDQSRFYQRQGELKASTLEARNAIELQPEKIEPYFVIIDNLLTAGDAVNAERQVKRLMAETSASEFGPAITNRANLILAKARLRQGKHADAMAALEQIQSPSEDVREQAGLLRGQIHLAAGNLDEAEDAFQGRADSGQGSIEAMVGLSKIALAREQEDVAREWLAKAEELNPDHSELWLWKAQLAHLSENWERAEESYIRALEDIGQYDVMTARKYTTISALISVLRAQSKFSEAFVYEEILAKSPPGKIRSSLMAAEEALRNNELLKAERYLNEVLAQAPEHEQSVLMLGLVRFRQGRPQEAQALLAPIAGKGDSEIASKMLAATMLQMGDAQGAQTTLAGLDNGDSDPEILTLVAIAALESGEQATGEALMEKALSLNPDNHALRLRYASYLSQRNEHQRAIAQIMEVREQAPKLNEARQALIQAQVQSGDMKVAIATADSWIKEDEANLSAWMARGNLALTGDKPEQAQQFFDMAREKSPKAVEPLIAMGQLALVQGERSAALNHFQEAVELAPEHGPALQGLLSLQNQEEARTFLQKVVASHPEASRPRLILLEIALLNNHTEEADQLTATLLERSDEVTASPYEDMVAGIYSNAVKRLRANGQLESSAAVLQRAQALFPDDERVTIQAAKHSAIQGDIELAMTILDRTKTQKPHSAAPLVAEAEILESEGQYEQAAERFRQALEKTSTTDIITGYVRNLQRSGHAQEAITYLKQELEARPENLQLRLNLALLQQSAGETDGARANYERLLAAMPDNTVVLNNLAWLYHKGDDARAIELAERAYQLSPDNAAIADTYGWIMLKAGNHRESVPVLEKAHELQPDSEEIARHLAEAYRVVGMDSAAQRILEKFGEQG